MQNANINQEPGSSYCNRNYPGYIQIKVYNPSIHRQADSINNATSYDRSEKGLFNYFPVAFLKVRPLQSSKVEIDNQMPHIYYSWQER